MSAREWESAGEKKREICSILKLSHMLSGVAYEFTGKKYNFQQKQCDKGHNMWIRNEIKIRNFGEQTLDEQHDTDAIILDAITRDATKASTPKYTRLCLEYVIADRSIRITFWAMNDTAPNCLSFSPLVYGNDKLSFLHVCFVDVVVAVAAAEQCHTNEDY